MIGRDWMQVMFCNCCGTGCDCGCVEDCRLVSHREAAGVGPIAEVSR